jgi:hypothetical protein
MEQPRSAPRWRFLITSRWLAWHAFTIVALAGMCWLGDWQLHRALFGNSLSWSYTFEWPLFAVMGGFFWAKTIRDEFQLRGDVSAAPAEPGSATARDAHLARLHREVRGHGRWHGLR